MQKCSFFPGGVLSKTKLVFFQTIKSVKHAFAARSGSGKPAFFHALFLKRENKIAEKLRGNVFPLKG